MDASPFFSGSSLSFDITGDGVAIDPATRLVTLGAGALFSGVAVRVQSEAAGETAEAGFEIRILPEEAAPRLRTAPRIVGAGVIGVDLVVEAGLWDGEPEPVLTRQWLRDGAQVPAATGARFTPGPAEDGALVTCRVTATNALGTAVAETAGVRIAYAPPRAVGAQADVALVRGTGEAEMPLAAAFAGAALRFSVTGANATVDAETGVVSIPTGADRAAERVTVTATNSGGAASVNFAVTVQAAPEALGAPDAVFARGAGSAAVAAQAFFAGTALGFALEEAPAGATIDAASGVVTIPTAAALSAILVVRARNLVGSAAQNLLVKVVTAPVALGAPPSLVFAQGTAFTSVSAHDHFEGAALGFALVGAPEGVTINSQSGAVTIPTSAALTATLVVQATNVAGAAQQSVTVTVLEEPIALEAPAPVAFAQDLGAAMLATQAYFRGGALSYALDAAPAGATINPATGLVTIPTTAALSATLTVRATNALGSVVQSVAVTVMAAPRAVDAPAAVVAAQNAAPATVAMAPFFAGAGLVYSVTSAPAGVTIHATSGLVTIQTAVIRSGTVAVRATNAVGSAAQTFALMVLAAPAAVGDAPLTVFAQGARTATVATRSFFTGTNLIYALGSGPAGAAVDGVTGVATVPTALPLSATLVVRGMNPLSSVPQRFPVRVVAAPLALAAPAPAVFAQGPETATVSAQAFFDGGELTFALVSAPAGVTINQGSGLVTIPTAAALTGTVVVRATNVAGAAQQSLAVTVRAVAATAVANFETAAAALAETQFLFSTAAPAWTWVEEGYARLIPAASDRAHGNWSRGQGDGRYRCLLRAPLITSTSGELRPFGFSGRMTQTGANFRGLRAEAGFGADGIFALHLREYTGDGITTTTLASADAGWTWGAWHWLEVEFAGALVRARLHPETAAAPDWQVTGTTAIPQGGAFGPSAFALGTRRPNTEIRRLEFYARTTAPAAPLDGAWTLNQITVQK